MIRRMPIPIKKQNGLPPNGLSVCSTKLTDLRGPVRRGPPVTINERKKSPAEAGHGLARHSRDTGEAPLAEHFHASLAPRRPVTLTFGS